MKTSDLIVILWASFLSFSPLSPSAAASQRSSSSHFSPVEAPQSSNSQAQSGVNQLGKKAALSDLSANDALKRAMHFADLYNWSDAGPFFAQAEQLYKKSGNERNALYAHIGEIRATMEQRSLPEVSEGLATLLENNPLMRSDKQLRLFCLAVKGDIDGEIDGAPMRRDWEEALEIATELQDQKWMSRASVEVGFAMFLQGDIMSARKRVAGGLIRASLMHDVGAQIRYLAAIGTALVYLDAYDEALGYLDKASKLAAQNPDVGYPFLIQEGRLQAFKEMGKLAAAQQIAGDVIAQAAARHKYVKQAEALITASTIATARNDDTQAIRDLQAGIDLSARGGFKRLLADAQFKLAEIDRDKGRIAEAKQLAAAASQITQEVGDLYVVPGRLQAVGDLQVAQHEYTRADATYDRASDILDTIVGNVSAASAKLGVVTAMSDLYTSHFALLADHLHNPAKAYSVLEHARGRVITDLLMSGDRPDTKQELAIGRTIGRLHLDLSHAKSPAQIRAIRDKVFLAEQSRWIVPASGAWRSKPMQVAPLPRVQRSLAQDQVIFEYVLAEPHSYCLVITRERIHIVTLPDRERIETAVAYLLKEFKAKKAGKVQSRELYGLLLKPIPEARKNRWIIVPDGRLHLLPFEALRDASGEYVVSSHIVSYAPSATAMYLLSKAAASPEPPRHMLLAIGGIPYDQRPELTTVVRDAGYVQGALAALPGSRRELTEVNDALHATDSKLLVGEAATESAFKKIDLSEYGIIHLAVHGIADEKHPERAALILLNDSRGGDDGILQAFEIMQLHTRADLVVLSACDTAVGRLQGQEGIANISLAFLLAGAKSVVSTLWSTDDVFSAYLMKHFYAELAAGATISDALTEAKRKVIAEWGDSALPYYWASFTLEGLGGQSINPVHTRQVQAHVSTD